MPLVYSSDIAAILGLTKTGFFGRFLGRIVLWILRLDKVNAVYDRSVASGNQSQFIEALLYHLKIKYHISK